MAAQRTHAIDGALLPCGDVETPVFPRRVIGEEHLVVARCFHQGVNFVDRRGLLQTRLITPELLQIEAGEIDFLHADSPENLRTRLIAARLERRSFSLPSTERISPIACRANRVFNSFTMTGISRVAISALS